MNKHTPGPLYVGELYNGVAFPIKTQDGLLVAITRFSMYPAIPREMALANAHLFAAAPDMLFQLETVLTRLDLEAKEQGENATFLLAAQRHIIRRTIAQAKGETL